MRRRTASAVYWLTIGAVAIVVAQPIGCASSGSRPKVPLTLVDSNTIDVISARIEREPSTHFISGVVRRTPRSIDTTKSHLDIRFLGTSNILIAEKVAYFDPAQIPPAFRGISGNARFRSTIDAPIESIIQIEIRAHDEAHSPTP